MKTLITYSSQTGFTKKYATWLSEELKADCIPLKEAKKVKDMSFYNPVMREKWEKYVLKRLEPIVSYYPILYSLGDEHDCQYEYDSNCTYC